MYGEHSETELNTLFAVESMLSANVGIESIIHFISVNDFGYISHDMQKVMEESSSGTPLAEAVRALSTKYAKRKNTSVKVHSYYNLLLIMSRGLAGEPVSNSITQLLDGHIDRTKTELAKFSTKMTLISELFISIIIMIPIMFLSMLIIMSIIDSVMELLDVLMRGEYIGEISLATIADVGSSAYAVYIPIFIILDLLMGVLLGVYLKSVRP